MKLRTVLCGWVVAVLALLPSVGVAQLSQWSIEPANPKAQEAVRLVTSISSDGYFGPSPLSMAGNKITVIRHRPPVVGVPLPPPGQHFLELGRFPAGVYDVEVLFASEDGTPWGTAATLQFTVSNPATATQVSLGNFSDLWWNPAESGWGLAINHHVSNIIFAVWFVYGADGKPTWYFMPDAARTYATVVYTGAVYKTTGPYFGGVFNPAEVVVSLAGTATLIFTDYDRGTFTYTIDGVTGTKNIQRQGF